MAQWLKTHSTPPQDLSSVPETHICQLTTAYNSTSRSHPASWHPQTPTYMWHMSVPLIHTHTPFIILKAN